jgi:hypothetical protein
MANDLLYHYTNIGGLRGILENSCLWMTDINYLNDSEEGKDYIQYLYRGENKKEFLDIWNESLDKHNVNPDDFSDLSPIDAIEVVFGFIVLADEVDIKLCSYSASFCDKYDLLSQWRGYCPSEGGFSLGFDRKLLRKSVIKDDSDECSKLDLFILDSCLYREEEKRSLFKTHFESVVDSIIYERVNKPETRITIEKLKNIYHYRARCKHISFHEESEFRFLAHAKESGHKPFFREKENLFIPYLKLSFQPEVLKKILIGPCSNPELTEQSLKRYLASHGDKFKHVQMVVW